LSNILKNSYNYIELKADCDNCFGLCCVALPYAKSADFAFDKDAGTPCQNLQSNYQCGIHKNLRDKGFQGCTAFECFGAGQKVSQVTYDGTDWRENPSIAKEMFHVFPIMQQLHEMLCYLTEASNRKEAEPIHNDLQEALLEMEALTKISPKALLELHVPTRRENVNKLLLQTSELVRATIFQNKRENQRIHNKLSKGRDLIGANLKGADLRGANLRGTLLIAANLREADMRSTDIIGADLRDADLSGANMLGCLFLTQAQVNSAKGDRNTKLSPSLSVPGHWLG
jgi:uncharacterized protein YjbI with pentapeptide repeats